MNSNRVLVDQTNTQNPQPSDIPHPSTDTSNAENLDWLCQATPRRNNSSYKQLLACVKAERMRLHLTKKSDTSFGLAVHRAIDSYNNVKWPGSFPINPANKAHVDSVAAIVHQHIRNVNYNAKKKMNKDPSCTLSSKCQTNKENTNDENCVDHNIEDSDSEESLAIESDLVYPKLATNDFVIVFDEKKTAVFSAIVLCPFTTEEDLDFKKVELKVIVSILSSSIAGDVLIVDIDKILLIPMTPDCFALGLSDSKEFTCDRRRDCQLRIDSFVLLDLPEHADNWPLVGQVIKIDQATSTLTIQWYWLDEQEDNQSTDALRKSYIPWLSGGKPVEEAVSQSCHFFCRFKLENRKLPQAARIACKNRMG